MVEAQSHPGIVPQIATWQAFHRPERIDPIELEEALIESWLLRAPWRLAAAYPAEHGGWTRPSPPPASGPAASAA